MRERAQRLWAMLTALPIRLVKLLLAIILALAVLWGLIAVFRRLIWPLLTSLSRWWWERVRGKIEHRLAGYREQQAKAHYEREIARLAAGMVDPFADPFNVLAAQPVNERLRAAYETMVSYCWLLGTERKSAETAFDFATRLCDTSQINARAVWCLTRCSAAAQFSAAELAEADIVAAQEAIREVIAYVLKRLPAEEIAAKQQAYRRQYAEKAYEAEQEQSRRQEALVAQAAV